MINGSYSFGANKINLENETTSFKGLNFKELVKNMVTEDLKIVKRQGF